VLKTKAAESVSKVYIKWEYRTQM